MVMLLVVIAKRANQLALRQTSWGLVLAKGSRYTCSCPLKSMDRSQSAYKTMRLIGKDIRSIDGGSFRWLYIFGKVNKLNNLNIHANLVSN